MNFSISRSELRKYVCLVVMMAVPAIAFAQHKPNAPAPAPHATAPAHVSAPTHSGGTMQHTTVQHTNAQHTTTPSHTTSTTAHASVP